MLVLATRYHVNKTTRDHALLNLFDERLAGEDMSWGYMWGVDENGFPQQIPHGKIVYQDTGKEVTTHYELVKAFRWRTRRTIIDTRTGKRLRRGQIYRNPYAQGNNQGWGKDRYLIRRHLGGKRPQDYPMIFVGDRDDLSDIGSDSETPTIVVARNGAWAGRKRTEAMIDTLFGKRKPPHQVFREILKGGTRVEIKKGWWQPYHNPEKTKRVRLGNESFIIEYHGFFNAPVIHEEDATFLDSIT